MCRPGESLMRTPTLFKLLMCCMLLVVAGLVLPTPAWTAPGGITDPGTEATATPTGDGIAAPGSDIDPQALVAPQALAEPESEHIEQLLFQPRVHQYVIAQLESCTARISAGYRQDAKGG